MRQDPTADDLDTWLNQAQADDQRLAFALADAACRSSLLSALVQCRHDLGRSQTEVARFMQTTQSEVSELEGGITDPRLSTLQRYARAIDGALTVSLRHRGSRDDTTPNV